MSEFQVDDFVHVATRDLNGTVVAVDRAHADSHGYRYLERVHVEIGVGWVEVCGPDQLTLLSRDA